MEKNWGDTPSATLSHNKKDIKVSENFVKNFSDAHSPLTTV